MTRDQLETNYRRVCQAKNFFDLVQLLKQMRLSVKYKNRTHAHIFSDSLPQNFPVVKSTSSGGGTGYAPSSHNLTRLRYCIRKGEYIRKCHVPIDGYFKLSFAIFACLGGIYHKIGAGCFMIYSCYQLLCLG